MRHLRQALPAAPCHAQLPSPRAGVRCGASVLTALPLRRAAWDMFGQFVVLNQPRVDVTSACFQTGVPIEFSLHVDETAEGGARIELQDGTATTPRFLFLLPFRRWYENLTTT